MYTSQSYFGSKWFDPDYLFNQGANFFHQLFHFGFTPDTISFYHTILFFFGLFFLTMIAYCTVRMFEIRKKEHNHLKHEIEEYAHHQAEKEKKAQQGNEVSNNPRWIKTLAYLFSQHASDWKLAVIEADAMLEDLMVQLGFKGETLGDKLKSADQENFRSLTSAWEVHTIRNRIAHEGLNFELSQHEAKRIIAIYEQIFREYGYI
ncbi:MAG TPA: hypothetical protein VGO21_04860 [Candidatus Paceibacterota bacterium]|jgi:hypothetical protein|nr:hypothetical protein [Candidatus Paceibacterota bacterium]